MRDCILDEMVNLHGVAIPNHDDPSDRWFEFVNMIYRKEIPPLHLHAGIFELKYHECIGDHRCTDHSYRDWYRYFECLSLYRVKEEDLQELSVEAHGSVDTLGGSLEDSVKELNLKNQEWKGMTINLDIEAKEPNGYRKNIWYKVTGKEAEREGEIVFTLYTYGHDRFPDSGAILEGDNHEKVVNLLYKAGIITGEKTGSYTGGYGMDCSRWIYIYYRLTDQAIEYANRKR